MDKCTIMQNGKVLFSAPEMTGFGCIFYNLTGRNFYDKKGRFDQTGYQQYIKGMKEDWGVTDGGIMLLQDGKVIARGSVGNYKK